MHNFGVNHNFETIVLIQNVRHRFKIFGLATMKYNVGVCREYLTTRNNDLVWTEVGRPATLVIRDFFSITPFGVLREKGGDTGSADVDCGNWVGEMVGRWFGNGVRNGVDDGFGYRVTSWVDDRLGAGFVDELGGAVRDGWGEGVGDGVGVGVGYGVCGTTLHTEGGREEAPKR